MATATRLFRVFISSTFNDFVVERNALQNEVFPRLQDFCRQRGVRFQAVDLRWGVSEEAGRDQQTLDVCLQEIRRCQRTTRRPNFIAMLGSRYGWRPLPPRIPADEFLALLAPLSGEGQDVIQRWYRRDDNAQPPNYLLQPIPDQAAWDLAEQDLRSVLRDAVAAQGWTGDDPRRFKYETSATHQEILLGLLQPPQDVLDPRQHVCCYRRVLDLPRRIDAHSPAHGFADYVADPAGGGFVRDADAMQHLESLTAQIRRALPAAQVHEYAARWTDQGIEFDLSAFCRRVECDLRRQIEAEMECLEQAGAQPGGEEARIHHDFAVERAHGFVGRRDALERVAAYLADEHVRDPLVISGPSGVGKTAVLARAARLVGPGCLILERYLGVTPAASGIRALLTDLSREIADHAGSPTAPPSDIRELAAEWCGRLEQMAAERPVVLFLDALDQLSPADDAHTLFWLTRPLPPGVKLVASVLAAEGDAGACARTTEALVPAGQWVRLGPLSEGEAAGLLEQWLQKGGRALHTEQRAAVGQRLSLCGLPLYVRGLFQEVRRWTSYDGLPLELAADTAGLLRQLFDRLEERRHHSPVLVRRSVGYLAAGRHGLTEDELLDVLSADGTVMRDFREHSPTERCKPEAEQMSRLPPILWSRLRFDLADYLAEREADGTAVLSFFHREIGEVARSRCLQAPDRLDLHGALAGHFGSQALVQAGATAGPRQLNLRKLAELPYQLTEGELWPELAGFLAGDFAFLKAKTEAGQVFDLVEDYNRGRSGLSHFPGFAPWYHFVRGQASVLGANRTLFFQQAFNKEVDNPVSRAAQQQVGSREEPEALAGVAESTEGIRAACLSASADRAHGLGHQRGVVDGRPDGCLGSGRPYGAPVGAVQRPVPRYPHCAHQIGQERGVVGGRPDGCLGGKGQPQCECGTCPAISAAPPSPGTGTSSRAWRCRWTAGRLSRGRTITRCVCGTWPRASAAPPSPGTRAMSIAWRCWGTA